MIRWKSLLTATVTIGCALAPDVVTAQSAPPQKQTYFGTESLGRRVVRLQVLTNAPYSADVSSTVTQVLADGTRIEQSTTGKVFRDAAGRMRREQQVLGLGPLAPGASPVNLVTITDPTTSTTYTINDQAHTATRMPYSQVLQWNTPTQWITIAPPGGRGIVDWLSPDGTAPVALRLQTATLAADLAATVDGLAVRSRTNAELTPQGVRQGGARGGGGRGAAGPSTGQAEESLGTKLMEGVAANGIRVTQTIPVGQIGNDRPIVVTDETWESPDLQVLVYSKHHDPRSGDVEYRLRNISRNEPPATLFQVPAGYTVVDPLQPYAGGVGGRTGGGGRGGGRGGVPEPAPPRAPGQ